MQRIIIIVSGSGTNMENIVKSVQSGALDFEVAGVIGDREGIASKERAERLNVPYFEIARKKFESKAAFEQAMTDAIEDSGADWIVLAGFMRILSDDFVLRYWGRIINIHPSYLPNFPGAHGIRDAFEAKVPETGVTIHFVDTGVDTGQVILQEKLPIRPEDTLESLEERVHALEYVLYPKALAKLSRGEVAVPAKPAF